jgi:hypothetical protein
MLVTWCTQKNHRRATARCSQMTLGTEATLTASQRRALWGLFTHRVPAAAACWWARMTVASP